MFQYVFLSNKELCGWGEYFRDRITYFITFCRMCINGGSIAYNWTTVSYLHEMITGAVNTEREYVTFVSASIEFVWLLYVRPVT